MEPILVVNPASDDVFADFARVSLDDGAARVADLERRLRSVYPNAVVHARELAAEPFQIWYVYREGYWLDDRATGTSRGGQENHVGSTPRPESARRIDSPRRREG
jgi:hypothetical protein